MNIQEPIVIVHLAHGNFSHIDCVGVPLARVVVACDGVPERFAATRQLTAEADIAAAVAAYNAARVEGAWHALDDAVSVVGDAFKAAAATSRELSDAMFGLFSVTRRKTSAESLLAAVTETSDARAAARETLQRALEALDGLDEVIRTASDDINPTQAGQSAPRGYIGGDEHVTH